METVKGKHAAGVKLKMEPAGSRQYPRVSMPTKPWRLSLSLVSVLLGRHVPSRQSRCGPELEEATLRRWLPLALPHFLPVSGHVPVELCDWVRDLSRSAKHARVWLLCAAKLQVCPSPAPPFG